jgi:uncharacterized protein (DUF427 family)
MQDLLAEVWTRLRHEPIERRIRARDGERTIVDSTAAVFVWEPRRISPSYAVPVEDVRSELAAAPAADGDAGGVLHPGIPFSVHSAAGEPVTVGDRAGAGFLLEELPGYVVLDFDAFDWYEEDERVHGHPRDPYHRIDVRQTSRPVRIEIDGQVLAESTAARMLFETSLHTRFYLPKEDVHGALEPSARRSFCPYKGQASYWSVGGYENIAWSYEQPLVDMTAITGLVAFWDEVVDVYLDGELRVRPEGPFAAALREEFGV